VAVRLFNKLAKNPNLENNPNTGGMGGFSPHPWLDGELTEKIMNKIAVPTVLGFKEATGHEYVGVIYFGLMISEEREPSVLEINVRLGDPETQPILLRMTSDVVPALLAAAKGDLSGVTLEFDRRAAVGVVLAAENYPAKPTAGDAIDGLAGPFEEGVQVFHAGTARAQDGRVVTAGGRVLTVCALGDGLDDAARRAYDAAARIHFRGMQLRKDIGKRA